MITYLLVTPVSAQLMRGIIEAAAHHSTSHLYSAVHLYCTMYTLWPPVTRVWGP